jgi:hypothetical protein
MHSSTGHRLKKRPRMVSAPYILDKKEEMRSAN